MKQVEKSGDALAEIQHEIDKLLDTLDEMAFMMRTSLSKLKAKRAALEEKSDQIN